MMPPPMFGSKKKKKTPGVVVEVGIGKAKPPKFGEDPDEEDEPDDSDPDEMDEDESDESADAGLDHVEEHDEDPMQTGPSGAKASREKAVFVPSTHHCQECLNYQPETGECEKVDGIMDPNDLCIRYFKHVNESDEHTEPDDDQMGGPSDHDADNGGY